MENKNNTDSFVKITQNKEEVETNGKKAISFNYKIQVEDMNLLEMFSASMYLLESIIKRLKSGDTSLTEVLSVAFTALENANYMVANELEENNKRGKIMFGNNHSIFADLIALESLKEIRNELKNREETENNQKTETKTETTEESKWIGCFCRFWDRETEGKLFPFYGTLVGTTDKWGKFKYLCGLAGNKDNPNKDYVPFRFCEPVKPEEIKFFIPEVKKDESNNA